MNHIRFLRVRNSPQTKYCKYEGWLFSPHKTKRRNKLLFRPLFSLSSTKSRLTKTKKTQTQKDPNTETQKERIVSHKTKKKDLSSNMMNINRWMTRTCKKGTNGKTTRRRTKGVTFYSKPKVWSTIALDDFTEEEFQAYWYSSEEIEKSTAEVFETVSLLNIDHDLDDEHHCKRGLETLIGHSRRVKIQRRRTAASIVLKNQEKEKSVSENLGDEHSHDHNQDEAAREYSRCCKGSNAMEYMLGVADAYEARAYCCGQGKRRTPPSLTSRKWN